MPKSSQLISYLQIFRLKFVYIFIPPACLIFKQKFEGTQLCIHIYYLLLLEDYLFIVEEVRAPQAPGELCWRESKLLVGPPMPDR
jgi:hypothetical protein